MTSSTKVARQELTPEERETLDFLRKDPDGMGQLLEWFADATEEYFKAGCNRQAFIDATSVLPGILRRYLADERSWCARYIREHPREVADDDDSIKTQLTGYRSLLRRLKGGG